MTMITLVTSFKFFYSFMFPPVLEFVNILITAITCHGPSVCGDEYCSVHDVVALSRPHTQQ